MRVRSASAPSEVPELPSRLTHINRWEPDGTVDLAQSPTSSLVSSFFCHESHSWMSAFPVHLVEDKAEPLFTALTDLNLVFCTKINFNGEIARNFTPLLRVCRSGARCLSPSAPYEAINCCSAEKGNKTPSRLFDLFLLYLSSPSFFFSRAYPQPPRLLLSFSVISHHYVESRKTLCALRAVHFQPNLITDTS